MSIFDTSAFEQSGNTDNDRQLDNTDDIRESVIELSQTALRTIRIFSPDLEYRLYNNEVFINNLVSFCRGNRHAQIQILVADSSAAIQRGHRIIRLTQQLTSAMQIRNTPEDYQDTSISFMQVDQSGFIYKPDASINYAIQSVCKHRSNKLLEFYTPAWEQAEQDMQMRRFTI